MHNDYQLKHEFESKNDTDESYMSPVVKALPNLMKTCISLYEYTAFVTDSGLLVTLDKVMYWICQLIDPVMILTILQLGLKNLASENANDQNLGLCLITSIFDCLKAAEILGGIVDNLELIAKVWIDGDTKFLRDSAGRVLSKITHSSENESQDELNLDQYTFEQYFSQVYIKIHGYLVAKVSETSLQI